MKILLTASECAPFIKTGGLADVIGALPKSFAQKGYEVAVIIPYYKKIKAKNEATYLTSFYFETGYKKVYCGIFHKKANDVDYYFLDNEEFFNRDNIYGHFDDGERFAYFCNALLEALQRIDFFPDIIHCNDWQTGLVPHLLNQNFRWINKYKDIKTVLSIHNIQFQGIFSPTLCSLMNVSFDSCLEYNGCINFLKAGIVEADLVTTVSETYRDEILTDFYGYGLEGILKRHQDKLYGIVNGIDTDLFNPKTDNFLEKNFDPTNFKKNRSLNKKALQKEYDLPVKNVPLFGLVSRLTEQKGFELFKPILEEVITFFNTQFFFMGSGDKDLEDYFNYLTNKYPKQVKVFIGYNESLAQKIYGSVDFFLMPSKFEPCGLSQLISMRYGAIPIVRETGGLKDTVLPYNKFTGEGYGFSFKNFNAHELKTQMENAIELFKDKTRLNNLIERILSLDFSWEISGQKYLDLYKKLK